MSRAGPLRYLTLRQRLTLLLLVALALLLVPLGIFTVREAQRASLRNLETSILLRLGFYNAASSNGLNVLTLSGLVNEYGGFGFISRGGRLRFTDTATHTLPAPVASALDDRSHYSELLGDRLYVVLPTQTGAVGLAVRAIESTTLTRRLILAYSLAAGGLFVLIGLFGAQALGLVLAPLERLRQEIAQRSPERLELLPLPEIPELKPTAVQLNGLLQELSHALARSRAQEAAARRFAGQASHELRTPLTALGGYLEVAQRRPDEPRALAGALREMARMRALLDTLLLLARLEGRAQPVVETIDLRAFAAQRFPDLLWQNGAETPGQISTVRAEPELLEVALGNLLSNARRYGAPPFTLRAESQGGYVWLLFEDAGRGFSEGMLERGLEPFIHSEGQGTGLGLAIVRAVMDVHGGVVRLENRLAGTPPEVSGARIRLGFSSASG